MAKKIIEKSDTFIKFKDGSVRVKCHHPLCGQWEEFEGGSKQANLLNQVEGSEKKWECRDHYLMRMEEADNQPKSWEIGQAINLSVQELTRNGVEITPEKIKAKVRFYLPLIQEIQNEHRNG